MYERLPIRSDLLAVGLTDGLQPVDGGEGPGQTLRQSSFPIALLETGMCVRIEKYAPHALQPQTTRPPTPADTPANPSLFARQSPA